MTTGEVEWAVWMLLLVALALQLMRLLSIVLPRWKALPAALWRACAGAEEKLEKHLMHHESAPALPTTPSSGPQQTTCQCELP